LRHLRLAYRVTRDAFYCFLADDGWAIASHIALSTLLSLFPFLIFVAALTGYFGGSDLAATAAGFLLDYWPPQVAGPIANEVTNVLTTQRSGLLTAGVLLAIYFSSNGIESLRIGLNRAYDVNEARHWLLLRLESIAYVIVGAIALIALAFLIVLGPLAFRTAVRYAPLLAEVEGMFTLVRYSVASILLVGALVIAHKWLPSGRRRLIDIAPGIVVTLLLWVVTGAAFGRYLAEFANNYVSTYAGLASAMIALVFLYWIASIFVFGGELNSAITRLRAPEGSKRPIAR
jgi:membrane protein